MYSQNIYTIKIGGEAGQGIKSTGLIFAKLATRSGYHIYTHTEYGSLIKGGHNMMQINISKDSVTAPRLATDFLIAFNQETINRYGGELASGSQIVIDIDRKLDLTKIAKEVVVCQAPLSRLAREIGSNELIANMVALGVTAALLGGDLTILKEVIFKNFSGGEVAGDLKAAQLGYDYATKNFSKNLGTVLTSVKDAPQRMVVNGNEALALGAIAGGLQFAAIYPMTPITGLLSVLASLQNEYGFIYKQPEDEIAAINMAIGASYAGARALTATSGGGFCLMTEGLGLAAMAETPLVIIEGMRPGPATCLPTWTSQGDLQFVLHAHQGEFPRIVLAAGDVTEAFNLTKQALDLASKYQTPVILLVDKTLCENDHSVAAAAMEDFAGLNSLSTVPVDTNYQRYAVTDSGISPRALPGSGNFFVTNSDEHNEIGFSSEEALNHVAQTKKRQQKEITCAKEDMPDPELLGPKDADVTLVSWGSNKGAIIETLKNFDNVNFLHLTWLSPFPVEAVCDILSRSKHIIDVECNYTAQLAALIREKTGIEISDQFLKYDGRPIYPEEITAKIDSVLSKKL
ncbi:MAG: 2-oxoacid:acceptor oxidoreductase subunit alpha [candidate division WWE3 bacterium]|nr:2-oxoacid:acceptor oxidoreductase subunit alpha [candidate division WWE3 bacterium]